MIILISLEFRIYHGDASVTLNLDQELKFCFVKNTSHIVTPVASLVYYCSICIFLLLCSALVMEGLDVDQEVKLIFSSSLLICCWGGEASIITKLHWDVENPIFTGL